MAKQNLKEKYGFEDSRDRVAGFLWRRLFEFVYREDREKFIQDLSDIARLELKLQGNNSPKESVVLARVKCYFTDRVPKVYDWIMEDFKRQPKTYYLHGEDAGQLERFKQRDYYFYTLNEIAEDLEGEIKSRYYGK